MFDSSFVDESDQITEERFSLLDYQDFFYMKIEQVPNFLLNYSINITRPFSMITHRGDLPVTSKLFSLAKQNPLFVKWYGQNIDCDPDDKLTSIPIGLENDFHYPHIQKRKKIREASLRSMNNIPNKLLYMNFSFYTNPEARRNAYLSFHDKSWVTDECSRSINHENYPHWIEQVLNHHYVLCPVGNGIDTHRLWETLYLGRIPIVLNHRNAVYYRKLPILFVDSWSEITQELLEERVDLFSRASDFNLNMLRFSWWANYIKGTN
jgi:hypothetical protein